MSPGLSRCTEPTLTGGMWCAPAHCEKIGTPVPDECDVPPRVVVENGVPPRAAGKYRCDPARR